MCSSAISRTRSKPTRKLAAREGLVKVGREVDFGNCQLWTRVNSLDSPWCLDDLTTLVTEIGNQLDVIMIPKVEGAWDIHYVDRLLAQLEARAGIKKPIMVHALLETALGVANVEDICAASPRMQGPLPRSGRSRGEPSNEDDSGRRWTSRISSSEPIPIRRIPTRSRTDGAQQDLWHYTMARMVDACNANGILPVLRSLSATSRTRSQPKISSGTHS